MGRPTTPSAMPTPPGSSACGRCRCACGPNVRGREASMAEKVKPTWAARLPGGLAPAAWDFLHSLPHDRFLWPYDVDGTAAHVKGLESAGVLSRAEAAKLVRELQKMRDHPHLIDDGDEDVH